MISIIVFRWQLKGSYMQKCKIKAVLDDVRRLGTVLAYSVITYTSKILRFSYKQCDDGLLISRNVYMYLISWHKYIAMFDGQVLVLFLLTLKMFWNGFKLTLRCLQDWSWLGHGLESLGEPLSAAFILLVWCFWQPSLCGRKTGGFCKPYTHQV